MTETENIDPDITCVCLDAEFVEGDEIIELSIFALDGAELYHGLYSPQKYRDWDSTIHHITPDMVADAPGFGSRLPEVQRILDKAEYLVGFAVDNDTSHMARQGVTGLELKRIIELRDWFWINHGAGAGLDLFQGVSLASVAESLGVSFGDEGMHSASGDTRATLECFRMLYRKFTGEDAVGGEAFRQNVDAFDALYAERRDEYDRTHAEGYAFLVKYDNGYMLRVRREPPASSPRVVASVKVADRRRAEVELHNLMSKRQQTGKGIYRLTAKDVEEFKAYTNGFDSEEHAYFNKLKKLSGKFNVSGMKRR